MSPERCAAAIAIAALALVGVAVSRDARAQEPPMCRNKAATIVGTSAAQTA